MLQQLLAAAAAVAAVTAVTAAASAVASAVAAVAAVPSGTWLGCDIFLIGQSCHGGEGSFGTSFVAVCTITTITC